MRMLAAFIDFKPYYLPRAELVMLEHAFDGQVYGFLWMLGHKPLYGIYLSPPDNPNDGNQFSGLICRR